MKTKYNDFLFRLFRPSTWFNQLEVSEKVDEFILKLIEQDCLISQDDYHATFKTKGGEVSIWIANFPYGCGQIDSYQGRSFVLKNYGPSFRTRYKLYEYLAKKKFEKHQKELKEFFDVIDNN